MTEAKRRTILTLKHLRKQDTSKHAQTETFFVCCIFCCDPGKFAWKHTLFVVSQSPFDHSLSFKDSL